MSKKLQKNTNLLIILMIITKYKIKHKKPLILSLFDIKISKLVLQVT